jgi:hypothetical protein
MWSVTQEPLMRMLGSTRYLETPKLMGHSGPMVTLSTYTGSHDDEIVETGEALRKTLGL